MTKKLSAEEKRKRMMEFFHETQDFFQLKDVEKICSQEKGIVQNTVKDVLQHLVEDGLINSEKIGTSTYYWALPSEALKKREAQIAKATQDLLEETARNSEMKQCLEAFSPSQDDDEKRQELVRDLSEWRAQKEVCLKELSACKENNPELYVQMEKDIDMCREACNRWVDNIQALKYWLKNKFKVDESTINKQFEIPNDIDYVE